MKKVFSFAAVAAAALAFTACQKNNNGVAPELDGNTYAGVSARISHPGAPRAVTDKQELVDGVEGEDLVKGGYVFFKDFAGVNVTLTKVTDKYTSNPFKTSKGTDVALTLIINKPTTLNLIASDFDENKKVGLEDLPSLIAADGFTMTGMTTKKVEIKDAITKEQVEQGTDASKNNFNLGNVERVVAKAQAYLKEPLDEAGADLKKYGELGADFKWALAGSAKTSYLFTDKAGTHQMDETSQLYTNLQSAVHGVGVDETVANLANSLQKVSDNYTDTALKGNFEAKTLAKKEGTDKSEAASNSVFFFENSCASHAQAVGDPYPYKRFAYYKVYATLMPKNGKKLQGDKLVAATADDYTTERNYTIQISKELYAKLTTQGDATGKKWSDAEFTPVKSGDPEEITHYLLAIKDKPYTFYIGSDDVMYCGLDAALKAGLKTVRKYDGGKMVYLTVVNRQKNAKGVTINADTRRNNIYQITVDGFDALGLNFDPVDPKDPNIPNPGDNPFEPKPDPDKEIDEAETWMRVSATILQWNYVTRNERLK